MITAANSDFARAVTRRCAEMGVALYVSVRSEGKASSLRRYVQRTAPGARLHTFIADVGVADEVRRFAQRVSELTDAVDVLINNAARWAEGPFAGLTSVEIEAVASATLTGSVVATRAFLPLLRASGRGDIINLCSLSADPRTCDDAHEAYVGAKRGQGRFGDALRDELLGSGLRLTTIYPARFTNLEQLPGPGREGAEAERGVMTAQEVWNAVWFALGQDRRCSVDAIRLSNSYATL